MEISLGKLIRLYDEKGINAIKNIRYEILMSMKKLLDNRYYLNKSLINDMKYDTLVEFMKNKYPDNEIEINKGHVECKVVEKNKCKLPYYMGSMDKIKPDTKALLNWKKIYNKNNMLLSCKVDGVSALYYTENNERKLYTRGNGIIATDISYLLDYINIPNINGYTIRGELIISKEKYEKKYKDDYSTCRNLVSGLTNRKHNLDKNILKDIDFIGYEVISPVCKPSKQMKVIEKLKIKCIEHKLIKNIDLTNEYLSDLLNKWRLDYEYEIDGIIICDDGLHRRMINKNPKHAKAFKTVLTDQKMESMVVDVIYEASSYGYLKPRVQISPINIGGTKIEYCTGHNAGYIRDNNIGIGALVEIIRSGDVIPKINKVIKKSEKWKSPDVEYKWNKTNVDAMLVDIENNEMVKLKKICLFFNRLEIECLGKGNISRIMKGGYDSIDKILLMSIEDMKKIDGFKDKISKKIRYSIDNKINKITLIELMMASNIFGRGMGMSRIKDILNSYPDILINKDKKDEKITKISSIKGIGKKTAISFVKNIDKFIEFINKIKLEKLLYEKKSTIKYIKKSDIFLNKRMVMSGFRDKNIEKFIMEHSGVIENKVNNETSMLLIKDKRCKSTKINNAIKLDIHIMLLDDFKKKYNVKSCHQE